MTNTKKNRKLLKYTGIVIFFIFLSFLYTYLAWRTGWIYVGHDRPFHLERLEEAYQNVRHGHFFVSVINTYSFGKIGQAINAYYPWGNLLPYVIIRNFLVNPVNSYYAYLTLEQFLGLIIAFYCSMKILNSFSKGLLFAIILRFSTIIMFNDYTRVDIGESWAFVFVPIAFYGLYSLLVCRKYKKGVLNLSIGLSLELYCHVMVSFLTAIIFFILLIVWLVSYKPNKRILTKVFKSLVLSIFIFVLNTLVVTMPIVSFGSGITLKFPDKEFFATRQISFGDSVTAALNNNILSVINIGVIGIVLLIFCIANYHKFTKLSKSLFLIGFILMLFSTKLFPWCLLRTTIVSSIQFGWRLMPFAFLLLIFSFINEVDSSVFESILISSVVIILTLGSVINFINGQNNYSNNVEKPFDAYSYNLNYKTYKQSLSNNHVVRNSFYLDYLPITSLKRSGFTYNHIANINGRRKTLEEKNIVPIYQGEKYIFDNKNAVYRAELPFVIYNPKDYLLKVNNKFQKLKINKNRLLSVSSKEPIQSVEIRYKTPKNFIYARYISLVSLIISILLILYPGKVTHEKIKI